MNEGSPALPPLVVLPGMDGTGDLFRPFVERLARRRAVEVVGYPKDAALDYAALTELVQARVPRRGYHLLAESFSGPIAIELAARDPNVTGLILVSTFVRHPLPSWLAGPAQLVDIRWLPRALIEGFLLGSDPAPGVRERLAAVLPTIPPAVMRTRALAALRADARMALARVTCPILCVVASKDLLLGTRGVRAMRAVRTDFEVELISGPHMLLEARAAETAAVVERFCARTAGSAARRPV